MSSDDAYADYAGKDYIRGYTGYKGFNRTRPQPVVLPLIKPQSPEPEQTRLAFLSTLASTGTPPRTGTASSDSSFRSSGSSPLSTGAAFSPLSTSGSSPIKPISGYNGSLRRMSASGLSKPESLGTSNIVSSTINIISHDQSEAVSPSSTGVQALAGYTGYIPRRIGQDLTGKSVWRALEEQQAAAPPSASPDRSAASAAPVSPSGPQKPPAISAITGYSGHIPQRFRARDGRFQVAPVSPTESSAIVAHGEPTTDIQRDVHVSGYSGYVPRDWSNTIGRSRWDAVTHNHREPAPEDVLASRSIYSTMD
eukprot:TRINITY_DN18585_c0_g1_i1.p1 TRINITY_DN18585_c0_g1~~TRINITY_DN18585_c0_g1_i1.p1  ORF type:complete len:309 (+),score=64.06 TRINITY_DN18585_c0_g1_i1:90-1016(+)